MARKLIAVILASAFLYICTACDEEDWDDCCVCICNGTACDDEQYTIYPEEEKCKAACATHCAGYSCNVKSYEACE